MTDLREPTDLQLMILNSLWTRKEATIGQIHSDVRARAGASRKTVATLLARLETRGMVRHRLAAREGVYRAAVTRRKVLVSRVGGVLGAMFGSSDLSKTVGPSAVHGDEVKKGDVARILALLKQAETDLKRGR